MANVKLQHEFQKFINNINSGDWYCAISKNSCIAIPTKNVVKIVFVPIDETKYNSKVYYSINGEIGELDSIVKF